MAEDRAMDWGETMRAASGGGFTLLEEGPAYFTVVSFRRGTYVPKPGAKLAASPQAELVLRCRDCKGNVGDVNCFLILNAKVAWKITDFFKSVALVPAELEDGAEYRARWDEVVGCTGVCTIARSHFSKRDGTEGEGNDVSGFLYGASAVAALRQMGMVPERSAAGAPVAPRAPQPPAWVNAPVAAPAAMSVATQPLGAGVPVPSGVPAAGGYGV